MFWHHQPQEATRHKIGAPWYVYLITIAFVIMMAVPIVVPSHAKANATPSWSVDHVTISGSPGLFNTLDLNLVYHAQAWAHVSGIPGSSGKIVYHYERSDGKKSGNYTLWVNRSDWYKLEPYPWALPINLPNGSYSVKAVITQPNTISSRPAKFTLDAPKPKVLSATFTMPIHAYYGPRQRLKLAAPVRVTLTPNHTNSPVNLAFCLNPGPNDGTGFQIVSKDLNSNVYTLNYSYVSFQANWPSGERKVVMYVGTPNSFNSPTDYIWVHFTNYMLPS